MSRIEEINGDINAFTPTGNGRFTEALEDVLNEPFFSGRYPLIEATGVVLAGGIQFQSGGAEGEAEFLREVDAIAAEITAQGHEVSAWIKYETAEGEIREKHISAE